MSGLLHQDLLDTEGPGSLASFSNQARLRAVLSGHSLLNSLAINTLQKLRASVYGTKFKAQLIKCLCLSPKIYMNNRNSN